MIDIAGVREAAGTGELLGSRYRLLEIIGRGGMADVFRARDERLGRDVAVKVLRDGNSGAETLRRMRAEVAALAPLNHPALVTLHDAATDDGGPLYLVMELVRGGSLAQERPPALDLAAVCADVAAALDHVHSRGIVHRDVKPGNVLVVRGGGVHGKLADLGIALIAGSTRLTAAGSIMGTAAYLSPEQIRGEDVTSATDVYALGLLIVEGLTGTHAFPGTAGESMSARLSRPPILPPGLAPVDAALLQAMTALSPADRPSAATVERALRNWTSDLEPSGSDPLLDDTVATDAPTIAVPSADADALRVSPTIGQAETVPDAVAPDQLEPTTQEPEHGPGQRRRVRPMTVVAALVVVFLVGIAIAFAVGLFPSTAPDPQPTRQYPAVEGELGDHLQELQELVSP